MVSIGPIPRTALSDRPDALTHEEAVALWGRSRVCHATRRPLTDTAVRAAYTDMSLWLAQQALVWLYRNQPDAWDAPLEFGTIDNETGEWRAVVRALVPRDQEDTDG